MSECRHPTYARRIERVGMPEGTYRRVQCRRCGWEGAEEFIPSKLTRAVMAAFGAADPDDFGISYRGKKGFSPVGLAMRIDEHLHR